MEIQEINIKRLRQCIKKLFRTNTNEVGFIHLTSVKINALSIGSIMVDLKLSKFTIVKYDKIKLSLACTF
jgi:hypothetical protein